MILWYRTNQGAAGQGLNNSGTASPSSAPSSPPPQAYAANQPQYGGMPGQQAQQGPQGGFFYPPHMHPAAAAAAHGHGMPPFQHPYGGVPFNGYPGNMHAAAQQQFQQQAFQNAAAAQQHAAFAHVGNMMHPPHMMMPPNAHMRRVRITVPRLNLGWMFGVLLLAIVILIQGGQNAYFYSALLLTVAFLYLRPNANGGANGANANAANANGGAAANGANGANGGAAANNGGNGAPRNGFDDLEHDANNEDAHAGVPAILRWDWRSHHGVTGEVLGFFCPLLFSLWPSWDPSILGDHPDLVRRRQEEANNNAAPGAPGAPANGNGAQPPPDAAAAAHQPAAADAPQAQ